MNDTAFRSVAGQSAGASWTARWRVALVVHPNGTQMAFTQRRTTYELWVLENLLPAAKERRS